MCQCSYCAWLHIWLQISTWDSSIVSVYLSLPLSLSISSIHLCPVWTHQTINIKVRQTDTQECEDDARVLFIFLDSHFCLLEPRRRLICSAHTHKKGIIYTVYKGEREVLSYRHMCIAQHTHTKGRHRETVYSRMHRSRQTDQIVQTDWLTTHYSTHTIHMR